MPAFLILIRKMRNFMHRPWFEKLWFIPVWLLLGASRFAIVTLPFKRLSLWLGMHQTYSWLPIMDARYDVKAKSIAKVVQMTAQYTPWKSNCFPQAITATILLRFYGIPYVLFLGVNRDTEDMKLNAHAWVTSGRIKVTGGNGFDQFTVVGCFASSDLRIG